VKILISSSQEMRAFGAQVGELLVAGDVVVLAGPLGAGKTTFAQGLAQRLGVQGNVTSPTFVVSRIHKAKPGGLALVHVDAYRLAGPNDLVDLDLETTENAVFLIEWGSPYVASFTESWIELSIERSLELSDLADASSGQRTVEITAVGARWTDKKLAGLAR
jgi:tRNA threonylcarbamoyladenosine biosynthesis protein TsaE